MSAASTDPTGAGTIVLIHGLWMTPRSWEHWAERYRSKGYNVLTPAWPGMEVEVEALNADPSPLETLDVEKIVDHYEASSASSTARRSSWATRSAEAHADPARPGRRRRRRRGRPGNRQGRLRPAALDDQVVRAAARPPAGRRRAKREAVPLRVREHPQPGGVGRNRERYAVPGPARVLNKARSPTSCATSRRRSTSRTRTAPRCSSSRRNDHIIPPKVARHNAEKYIDREGRVGVQGVPGPAAFPGRTRGGRGRRLRPRLGCGERDCPTGRCRQVRLKDGRDCGLMAVNKRPVVKEYATEEIVVEWEPRLCYHSHNCVRSLPQVFDKRAGRGSRPTPRRLTRSRQRSRAVLRERFVPPDRLVGSATGRSRSTSVHPRTGHSSSLRGRANPRRRGPPCSTRAKRWRSAAAGARPTSRSATAPTERLQWLTRR